MNCNVRALVDATRSFQSMPKGARREVWIYLLCKWCASKSGPIPPPVLVAPVLMGFQWVNPGFLDILTWQWSYLSNPALDFVVSWGYVSGGPYPNTQSFIPTFRSGLAIGNFVPGATLYAVVQARNSLTEVSPASNELSAVLGGIPIGGMVILEDELGGFWELVVDTGGNVGTTTTVGPASPPLILEASDGSFWQVAVDSSGNRFTQSSAGPANNWAVIYDPSSTIWTLVVDPDGNLGATS